MGRSGVLVARALAVLQQKDWRAYEYVCFSQLFRLLEGYLEAHGMRGNVDEERTGTADRFIEHAFNRKGRLQIAGSGS